MKSVYCAVRTGSLKNCLRFVFKGLMFIIIQTYALRSSTILILKLLRHFSALVHHREGAYKLCQLNLRIIKMINYNTSVCRYGKIVGKCGRICNLSL